MCIYSLVINVYLYVYIYIYIYIVQCGERLLFADIQTQVGLVNVLLSNVGVLGYGSLVKKFRLAEQVYILVYISPSIYLFIDGP